MYYLDWSRDMFLFAHLHWGKCNHMGLSATDRTVLGASHHPGVCTKRRRGVRGCVRRGVRGWVRRGVRRWV